MSWLRNCTDDAAVFAPFRDYLGLLNLVRVSPAPTSNKLSVQQLDVDDDFESNGVTVDCGGLMPFTVPSGRWTTRSHGSRFSQQYNHRRPALVTWCVFCRNNGETESIYTTHVLKDSQGKTTCPILRAYACPICGAKGDGAHTIKYCPARGCEEVPPAPLKTARTSTGFRKVSTHLAGLQTSVGAVGERRY